MSLPAAEPQDPPVPCKIGYFQEVSKRFPPDFLKGSLGPLASESAAQQRHRMALGKVLQSTIQGISLGTLFLAIFLMTGTGYIHIYCIKELWAMTMYSPQTDGFHDSCFSIPSLAYG